MANEFTIPGTLVGGGKASFGELERIESQILNNLEVTAAGDATIGIFTGAASVGAYNFGTGVTADSALIEYDHAATQMRFDIGGVPEITIDASGVITVITIAGDLTVSGTTTTVDTTNLVITDNIIKLNDGETGTGVGNGTGAAGIVVDRGLATFDAGWFFNDAEGWWGPTGPTGIAGEGGATQIIGNIKVIDSTDSAEELLTINGVGAIKIPAGTTVQRPSGVNGMVRYNSDLNNLEGFINGNWEELLNTGSSVTISGDLTMGAAAQIFIDDGTLANPGLAFSDDGNTGIFSAVDNSIGFVANGFELLRIGPTEIDAFANLDMNGNILFGPLDPVSGTQVGDRDFNDARYIQDTGSPSIAGNLTITDTGEALTVTRTTEGTGTVAAFRIDEGDIGTDICITFRADDSVGTIQTYGKICTEIVDNVAASLDAKMEFKLQEAGTLETLATLRQDPAGTGGLLEVTATAALYSDLAERYAADMDLEPGTVVVFGGEAEITMSFLMEDTAVAGVISTTPAFRMNSEAGEDKTHPYVALKGRVPCKVTGPVKKGDLLVTATLHGHAMSVGKRARPYTAFARALENFDGGTGVIEVAII